MKTKKYISTSISLQTNFKLEESVLLESFMMNTMERHNFFCGLREREREKERKRERERERAFKWLLPILTPPTLLTEGTYLFTFGTSSLSLLASV